MKLTTALRTTRANDIINAAGNNPKLKYYNGVESLTPAGTLLATLTVTGALGTASNGVIDLNETVTQNNANHVHSVWRDFEGDFGEDLLKRHYETATAAHGHSK